MSKHVDKRIRRFESKTLPSVKTMGETILGYKTVINQNWEKIWPHKDRL